MSLSLLGALVAAVCFGVGSVLQAIGARRTTASAGVDVRLLARVLGQWPFLVGLGLDLVGFLAELAALRSLPLYLVQAVLAASLAVTAVVAAWLLHTRLRAAEWVAVAAVCVGLGMLGLSSGPEGAPKVGTGVHVGVLVAAAGIGLVGMLAGRLTGPARAILLGLMSGFGFGMVAVGARVLTGFGPAQLFTDPAAYGLLLAGVVAFLFFASGLQRGAVTTTTAGMVLGETVAPALIGVIMLGDRTRSGLAGLAVAGFVVAVVGALALARFGEAGEGGGAPEPLITSVGDDPSSRPGSGARR